MERIVLHVVKWFPHASDIHHGVFIQKHIESISAESHILGFIDAEFPKIEWSNQCIYGANKMGLLEKIRIFRSTIARVKPDIIHFHSYGQDLWIFQKLAAIKNIPTVHSAHWSGLLRDNHHRLTGFQRWFLRDYLHSVKLVLPVSTVLQAGIQDIAPKTFCKVIPNIISEISSEEKVIQEGKSICVVGSIVFDIKRQDLILKAFRNAKMPNIELHFYGGGPDLESLKEQSADDPNIFVHGRIPNEEVLQRLPNHHVHIQFSAYETFGIAALEARKAGLWSISRSHFGASDFKDDQTLFAENEEELVETMQFALSSPPAKCNNFPMLHSSVVRNEILQAYKGL